MAKKSSEAQRTIHVSVVGLSGTEKEKGSAGVGKSCLCNRFLRPLADEYYTDHISVLSQSDFSGRVVNNDHFLYWGEVTKTSDEGYDIHFSVIEQTEFIDDASFQPFKGGKTEPYVKRCSACKLTSAEKLMYICKNQLGIEKEYEQKVLPDGKINVDGFICTFDASPVQNRTLEKQVEMVTAILNNLLKTKKPVVLATTKNDEAEETYVKEAERLINRKEFRSSILLVETSAHENINVELAFIVLAQMIDRTKGRSKIVPFAEAARARREVLDVATDAYLSLIRSQVTDYRSLWNATAKRLAQNQDFIHYVELFGQDKAMKEFRRHVKRLKDDFIQEKKQGYLSKLPNIFHKLLPDRASIAASDWSEVQSLLKEHPDFDLYFLECSDELPWEDSDLMESEDSRVPFDLLDSAEAENVFRLHLNQLSAIERTQEMKKQFKALLEEAGYVTPGKSLAEVKVLFLGRECFEALSEENCLEIYNRHQREITEKAKQNFQELLLEHADLFYQLTKPSGTITQEDIRDIEVVLQDDSRYKALDRLDQERQLTLYQHVGFVYCPMREHCPSSNCMDCLIETVVSSKMQRTSMYSSNNRWMLNPESNQLNLVLLGSGGIAESLANEIRSQCEDDEYELENILYTLDYRVISGDVSLPQNSFLTVDFLPQGFQQKEPLRGCFCIYSDLDGFEYVRQSLEKTLVSNLEQDRLPFQELPIIILFAASANLGEKDLMYLRDEGQSLSENFQCPFVDVTVDSSCAEEKFHLERLLQALRSLVMAIQQRAGTLTIYQTHGETLEPDIRIIMCLLCGDPYSVEHVLAPLLAHQCCAVNGEKSILLETYLGDCKRRVEVIVSSYHGANSFRDELVHGFILVYSTKRKASLATLKAFSMNIPNLPIQILAVTDSGGANAFFSSNLSHSLITEGNAVADALQAHFMTATSTSQQKTAFYTPFFKEVWDKKPEIEQAFHMEEPSQGETGPSQLQSTPEKKAHPPSPPHRHESYHTNTGSVDGSADSESHYERVPTDGSQGDDMEEPLSPTYVDDREPPLTPSDESDMYYNVFDHENGESLVKPSQLLKRGNLHDGYFDDTYFPPRNHREHWVTNEAYRSYTTGRRKMPPPTKPKPSRPQPGKLDLKNFGNVTNAIAKLSLSGKDHGTGSTPRLTKAGRLHAPLATPESVELGSDYAQVKDAVPVHHGVNDCEYHYATVQDAIHGARVHRIRHPSRREAGKAKFQDDDSSYEVSSPKDSNSPIMFGRGKEGDKTGRRKEKQKKDDEKQEKRRLKEEEKQKRMAEKEKEKLEKKKQKKAAVGSGGGTLKSGTLSQHTSHVLEEFAQSEDNPVPLFIEKCIKFIEEEGLDSEGIYRVPGNRAHVDLLFQKFEEDPNVSIRELDIPVNAVATALKDFFSKRLPHLMSQEAMQELIRIASEQRFSDRSARLFSLQKLLKNLPPSNFEIFKYVFSHFVRVAENCKLNSMDSKNLAICWWPTLLPIEFNDMGVFERMRPHLEDTVQNMIDQYRFLFCGQEEVVMV